MGKIIHRYILREIAVPFFMILCILTFVLLMGKIIQLINVMVNKGVSIIDISKLILFLMPSFLIYTIPLSLLIAILIGLGRLSEDNEIVILKASGLSLYQIALPVFLFCAAGMVLTAVTSFFLVPDGNYQAKDLVFQILKKKASLGIKEKVFIDDFRGILLYANRIEEKGDFMEDVIISDNRISGEPSTIFAKRASLVSDPQSLTLTLRLEKGSTHQVDAGMRSYRKLDFQVYDVKLDMESLAVEEKKSQEKSSTEMTFRELVQKVRSTTLEKGALRELAIELNKKMTIPLSCVFLGILGIPLGIKGHRSVKSRGLILGFMIALLYYLLLMAGEALAEMGRITPVLGVWTPNVIFGMAGLWLFYRAAREKRPLRFEFLMAFPPARRRRRAEREYAAASIPGPAILLPVGADPLPVPPGRPEEMEELPADGWDALSQRGYVTFDCIRGIGRYHKTRPDYMAFQPGEVLFGVIKTEKDCLKTEDWRSARKGDSERFLDIRQEIGERIRLLNLELKERRGDLARIDQEISQLQAPAEIAQFERQREVIRKEIDRYLQRRRSMDYEIIIRGQLPHYLERAGQTYALPDAVDLAERRLRAALTVPAGESVSVELALRNAGRTYEGPIRDRQGMVTFIYDLWERPGG